MQLNQKISVIQQLGKSKEQQKPMRNIKLMSKKGDLTFVQIGQ
jgi:hypothetical protein